MGLGSDGTDLVIDAYGYLCLLAMCLTLLVGIIAIAISGAQLWINKRKLRRLERERARLFQDMGY